MPTLQLLLPSAHTNESVRAEFTRLQGYLAVSTCAYSFFMVVVRQPPPCRLVTTRVECPPPTGSQPVGCAMHKPFQVPPQAIPAQSQQPAASSQPLTHMALVGSTCLETLLMFLTDLTDYTPLKFSCDGCLLLLLQEHAVLSTAEVLVTDS